MTKNIRKFELKLGRIGLILFLLGMSGMIFGFFLLGVTVGKHIDTYPEKMARYLPDRIAALISRLSQDATETAVAVRDEPRREKPEPQGMILQKAPAEAVQEKSPPPAAQPLAPKAERPVAAVREGPPTKEKSAARGKFIVQVVSYQEKSKAEALVRTIVAMGYAARTDVTELPDKGTWFRVVMGEFSGRPEAQAAIDALSRKTKGLNCVIRSLESTGN